PQRGEANEPTGLARPRFLVRVWQIDHNESCSRGYSISLPLSLIVRRRNAVLPKQIDHRLAIRGKGIPNRGTPGMNGRVALRSRRCGQDVRRRQSTAARGKNELRPLVLSPRELHVHALNLASRVSAFDVEIQADERE